MDVQPREIYGSEAKGVTCLLLQQDVLVSQAKQVEALLKSDELKLFSALDGDSSSSSLPVEGGILAARCMSSSEVKDAAGNGGEQAAARATDDIEVTLLGILDSDGHMTNKGRLSEFMSLMNCVVKGDHRALFLHILQNRLSKPCECAFVEEGGYRVLKKWIRIAVDSKRVDELKSVLKVLKKLPWSMEQFKASGLDAALKPLRHHEGVKKQFESLLKAWKDKGVSGNGDMAAASEHMRGNNAPSAPLSSEQTLLTGAIRERIVMTSAPVDDDDSAIGSSSSSSNNSANGKSNNNNNNKNSSSSSNTNKICHSSSVADKKEADGAEVIARPVPAAAPAKLMGMKILSMTQAKAAAVPVTVKASPTAAASAGVAPKAKGTGLLVVTPAAEPATEAGVSPKAAATTSSTAAEKTVPATIAATTESEKGTALASRPKKVVDMGAIARAQAEEEAAAAAASKAAAAPKPGKGLLKRSNGGGGDGDGPQTKRVKRSIRWADREGGNLKEVQTFYVENMKVGRTGAEDMRKKEKQMEKDLQVRKLGRKDSMQKSCEWVVPAKLRLSLEIQETSHNPVESKEKELMAARCAITSDVDYPDVTLIPENPEEPEASAGGKKQQHPPPGPPPPVILLSFTSGPVCGGPNSGRPAAAVVAAPSAPVPNGIGNAATFPPKPPAPVPPSIVPPPNMAIIYASVPEQLHFLEPALLERLAQDPQQVGAMISFDGTPNMAMVEAYRNSTLGSSSGSNSNRSGTAVTGGGSRGAYAPPPPPPGGPPQKKSRFS